METTTTTTATNQPTDLGGDGVVDELQDEEDDSDDDAEEEDEDGDGHVSQGDGVDWQGGQAVALLGELASVDVGTLAGEPPPALPQHVQFPALPQLQHGLVQQGADGGPLLGGQTVALPKQQRQ